jgi:hypothetical protein
MPRKRSSAETAGPETTDALDRWDDEGGSGASPASNALLENLESLSPAERQVLQRLGAAVVMEWNELPTDVQRTIFKHASAKNGTSGATELRARIARFLHDHKDDETRG